MSFRTDFESFRQPSQAREDFVYNSIIKNLTKDQIIAAMQPLTFMHGDKKITIKIMPNFIRVQGFYVPMSGSTAAKVAQHYGLSLPPSQLIRQINQNADIKITSKPLSGTGAIIDGKKYSGNDIVNLGVGRSDFAGAYNDTINKQLAEHGDTSGKVISGFAKEIAAPTPGNEGTLHMVGFFDKNGSPIQGSKNGKTPHQSDIHSEYGTLLRMVSGIAEVELPNGERKQVPVADLYNVSSYNVPKSSPDSNVTAPKYPINQLPSAQPKPSYMAKAPQQSNIQQGRQSLLSRIDSFLNQINI